MNAKNVCTLLSAARGLGEPGVTLPSPPDLARAVERIRHAVEQRELVGIFGDYDCDGITAAAQIVRYFERKGITPAVRLPHRVHDGYGLSKSIAQEWMNQGIRLLITVDTGISAIEPIRMLQEKGIDVIIVDHHHVPAEVPPAFALLHPALTPGFPQPHPSGAGMAFLLVHALEGGAWNDMHGDRALAMMGTVGDLVELKGVNRAIVQHGLLSLKSLQAGPLAELRDSVGNTTALTSTDIAFRVAPRLNAAGRMDDPMLALHALLRGGTYIERLQQLNRARQEITESLVLRATKDTQGNGSLMASASEEYPHGIIGLIAGSLTESTGCPSIIATINGEYATASLRSPTCYHVTEGLSRISDLLESFGGHAQAAGCSFRTDRWKEIIQRLSKDVTLQVGLRDLVPGIDIDAGIDASEISIAFAEALDALEPFGQGNPEPRFLLNNVLVTDLRRVGVDGTHLQAKIAGHKAIGFRMGSLFDRLSGPLDIVCRIGIDNWNGRRGVQVFVEDARSAAVPAARR
jgi:single-stranded-DNA-specific exonuclease